MKKDIRAYGYERITERDGDDREKKHFVQNRFMNGCM